MTVMGFALKLLDYGNKDSWPSQKFATKFLDNSDDGSRPNFSAIITNQTSVGDDVVRKRKSACTDEEQRYKSELKKGRKYRVELRT